ncbi:uncharacterized protein LOC123656144 [Melitaea cinxia]|uniref:uncharacterized protein LOC123656144 n=1 Tax=Melitaea cinxia TaxID=113334 RepID=UPI001E273E9C|nr:uncharacterized protein LOC123656144 [Melitaea cinxia]
MTKNCPPVPGGPASPGYGGAGDHNLRQKSGHHTQRRHLALVTYNTRTLRTDAKLVELEEALSRLNWDIIGLSGVRREGEDSITLKSGNLLYYREGNSPRVVSGSSSTSLSSSASTSSGACRAGWRYTPHTNPLTSR